MFTVLLNCWHFNVIKLVLQRVVWFGLSSVPSSEEVRPTLLARIACPRFLLRARIRGSMLYVGALALVFPSYFQRDAYSVKLVMF
jgi:hypothetical protein